MIILSSWFTMLPCSRSITPQYCYLPIRTVIQAPRRVDPRGALQFRLLLLPLPLAPLLPLPRCRRRCHHCCLPAEVAPFFSLWCAGKTWNRLRASIGQPNFY